MNTKHTKTSLQISLQRGFVEFFVELFFRLYIHFADKDSRSRKENFLGKC